MLSSLPLEPGMLPEDGLSVRGQLPGRLRKGPPAPPPPFPVVPAAVHQARELARPETAKRAQVVVLVLCSVRRRTVAPPCLWVVARMLKSWAAPQGPLWCRLQVFLMRTRSSRDRLGRAQRRFFAGRTATSQSCLMWDK